MVAPVGKCFVCGEPIYNYLRPCPKCGYQFSAGDNKTCPNSRFGLCQITEIPCKEGINWQMCNVKNKADSESWF